MKQRTIILGFVLVCVAVMAGCGNGDEPDKTPDNGGESTVAETARWIEVASGKGRVGEGSWFIDAPFDLVLDKVLVEPGQTVKKGDVVFTGKYDPEGGLTARYISDCEKNLKEAEAEYNIKMQEVDREIARLSGKIDDQKAKQLELDADLDRLKGPMEEAERKKDAAYKAYKDYSDGMSPPDEEGNQNPEEVKIQKMKLGDFESARAIYETNKKAYDDVAFELKLLVESAENLEKRISNIEKQKHGTKEAIAKDKAQAELADWKERIKQTEFRAPADGEVVVVDAASGDRIGSRNRVAFLIDPTLFVIKVQVALLHDEFFKKGAEFEMKLQFGKEIVVCKAVLCAAPVFDEEKEGNATVLLKLVDCETRAQAEELMIKTADQLEWMQITLKAKK